MEQTLKRNEFTPEPDENYGYVDYWLAFEDVQTGRSALAGVGFFMSAPDQGVDVTVGLSLARAKRAYRLLGEVIKKAENINKHGH